MRYGTTRFTYGALALRPDGSGVQTYIREFLAALTGLDGPHPQLRALVQSDAVEELPSQVTPMTRPVSGGAIRALYGLAPSSNSGVFHGLDVDLPLWGPEHTVATVHDLSVIDMPSASSTFRAAGESVLVRRALRHADSLIAVSEFTAERIEALSGRQAHVVELAPARWVRVPDADEVAAIVEKYSLPPQFIMQIGTVEPRKNVELVAAVGRALDIPCVLGGAGSTGPDAPSSAVGLGYVPTADLPALYAAATITMYASHYEGYGLPPVEAMACGGAVIASAVGALPQVVGDGAVLVSGHDEDDWLRAATPLVRDRAARDELVAAGQRVSAGLSWSKTAAETVRAYQQDGLWNVG